MLRTSSSEKFPFDFCCRISPTIQQFKLADRCDVKIVRINRGAIFQSVLLTFRTYNSKISALLIHYCPSSYATFWLAVAWMGHVYREVL